jgi:hypothetical protein
LGWEKGLKMRAQSPACSSPLLSEQASPNDIQRRLHHQTMMHDFHHRQIAFCDAPKQHSSELGLDCKILLPQPLVRSFSSGRSKQEMMGSVLTRKETKRCWSPGQNSPWP